MGGTSTDVSLAWTARSTIKREAQLGYYPFQARGIDIHSVGAGGGSIAWLDAGRRLRVGPQSAGAEPGPACYGRGGDRAHRDRRQRRARPHPGRLQLGGTLDARRGGRPSGRSASVAERLG